MILTVNGELREKASDNLAELLAQRDEHLNLESPKGYAICAQRRADPQGPLAEHFADGRRPCRDRPRHARRLKRMTVTSL